MGKTLNLLFHPPPRFFETRGFLLSDVRFDSTASAGFVNRENCDIVEKEFEQIVGMCMDKSGKLVSSVFIIMFFTVGSKVLGFLRDVLIAARFGSGMETDAYFVALSAAGILSAFLMQAIETTMIPVLSEVEEEEGKAKKIVHTNHILNLVLLVATGLLLFGWVFAPWIAQIMAVGFAGEQLQLAVTLTRFAMPVVLFSGVSAVFLGLLQSEHRFFETAAIQLPFNFVYIFFLLFLAGTFGIRGLAVAGVLATASQVVLQRIGLRKVHYRYRPRFTLQDPYVKKTLSLVPPVLLTTAISNLNTIVDRSMASSLAAGSLSALNFANKLNTLVHSVFIVALATVLFPILAQEARKTDKAGFKQVTVRGINVILLITLPATAGLIAFCTPIVRLAFERGAFDAAATLITAESLAFYSIGLTGLSLKIYLDKAFFSLQDTRTPMVFGMVLVSLKILLSFVFIATLQHKGLALATSLSLLATAFLLLYRMRVSLGTMGYEKVLYGGLKAGVAAFLMAVGSRFLHTVLLRVLGTGRLAEAGSLLVSVGAGVVLYLLLLYLLRVEELGLAVQMLRRRLGR